MKESLKFACKRWKSIFVTMMALVGIFVFCLFWPSLVGLLDLIPGVEQAAEHFGAPLTTLLTIPVYFIGLFLVLVTVCLVFGLFLIPSIVAVTGDDSFETVYQLFSTVWNQPWRLVIYELLLKFVKTLGFFVFTIVSVIGLFIAFLPSILLARQETYYFADVIVRSMRVVGLGSYAGLIPGARPVEMIGGMPWTLDVATFFLIVSLIMIAAMIVSYYLSMMSCGYTIIYVILRRKTTDEDMLAVEGKEEEVVPDELKEESEEKAEES